MFTAKRKRIKAPRRIFADTSASFNESWSILEDAIDCIYTGKVSCLSFEVLYRTVYSLVLRKQGPELYQNTRSALEKKLIQVREDTFHNEQMSYKFLTTLGSVWKSQCACLKMISDIMMYLDKVYCKENRQPLIFDMGLELLRDNIVRPLCTKIQESMLHEINMARENKSTPVNYSLLKEIVAMMETLVDVNDNYYLTEFEPYLLKETENYYNTFVQKHSLPAAEYINKAQDLLDHEKQLDQSFLNKDTCLKVLNLIEKVLISNNIEFILTQGMRKFIDDEDYDNMRLLMRLSHRQIDRNKVLNQLSQCILDDGLSIKENQYMKKKAQVAVKWVQDVIYLREKYNRVLEEVDDSNVNNTKTVNETFAQFLNQQGNKPAEYLTQYIDSSLRGKQKVDAALENSLGYCISLFRLIKDKDVFEKFYKQQLSKRLLQQRSSLEIERMVITKMKQEVGVSFTSKLEGMFRDITISQDYNDKFAPLNQHRLEYNPKVLTPTCWPFQNTNVSQDIVLPSNLERLKLDFENFYMKSHSGRTLRWAYHLGSMEIGFQFGKTYHDLNMSVYAAIIFLLFEDHTELTMQEINDLTHIPEQELVRQLLSISVAPKTRILKKRPMSKNINVTDRFSINYSFTAPSTKVKVLTVLTKPEIASSIGGDDSEKKQVMDEISESRKQSANAAMVRIMKGDKTLDHQHLIEKTTEILKDKFRVTNTLAKQSLEYLLEKEYIQRDSDNPMLYHYLS